MTELEVPVISDDDADIVQPAEDAAVRVADRADAPVSEVTERFLRAITAKVPLARIEELHLFAPLKQGGTETGIAVIAARAPVPPAAVIESVESTECLEAIPSDSEERESDEPRRHTVYTARYRLVLKGPERGKWEADVVDEADAPLITVEMVVRGVQRRAGEDTAIVRYSDRQIAHALRMEWPLPAA